MMKKFLPVLLLPMLLAGCAQFTNLSPRQQPRNANNLYPVEVAFNSKQQSLLWETIQPAVVVGVESYPLQRTVLMGNRWEGLIPVPAGSGGLEYQFKFDFKYNEFGQVPQPDSAISKKYSLRIIEAK